MGMEEPKKGKDTSGFYVSLLNALKRVMFGISFVLLLFLFFRYIYIIIQPPYGYASLNRFLAEVLGPGNIPGIFEVIIYLFLIPLCVCLFPGLLGLICSMVLNKRKI